MASLRLFASLVLIGVLAFPVFAGNANTGTVGGTFLKLGSGVRAPAMGEAFTAVVDDATAIFWNPAGITQLNSKELSMTHNVWLIDTSYSTMHYVQPLLPGHTLGASIFYLSYGNMMETTAVSREGTGRVFSPSAAVATVSYALKILENLSLGTNLKFINQSIDRYGENGNALDMGLLLSDFKGMNMGLVVQNIGSMSGTTLPQNLKLGISKRFLDQKLLAAFDVGLPIDSSVFLSLGGEYQLNDFLVVRAGGSTKAEEGSGGNFGIGLGLNLSRFAVDYAYVTYGDLGIAHRVGLRLQF